jgi:hypothetical protein
VTGCEPPSGGFAFVPSVRSKAQLSSHCLAPPTSQLASELRDRMSPKSFLEIGSQPCGTPDLPNEYRERTSLPYEVSRLEKPWRVFLFGQTSAPPCLWCGD